VTVLQPKDWKRIQDVLSKTNYEAQRQEAVQKEREELHNISTNMVKNWGNTIEVLICQLGLFLYCHCAVN
jgi:hypothetical protein